MRTEIRYSIGMSLEEKYIRAIFKDLNIKEYIKKEVEKMDFDIEKVREYYADLLAKKEEAVAVALSNKDIVIAERFELAKEEIAKQVEAELVANAEEPYKHDIELCEKFMVKEEVVDETTEFQGE